MLDSSRCMARRSKGSRDSRRSISGRSAGAVTLAVAVVALQLVACSASDDAVTSGPAAMPPFTSLPGGSSGAGGSTGTITGDGIGGPGGSPSSVSTGGASGPHTGGQAGAGGQAGHQGLGGCGAVTQTAENILQPVDIIFGIDNSGSMALAIAEVQNNLNAFSRQISAAGIDVRVIMLSALLGLPPVTTNGPCIAPPLGSGQCPDDSNPPAYVRLDQEVTSWDVLDVYVKSYPRYKAHLRENSLKTFVSISDDDATANTNPIGWIAGPALGLAPEIDSADEFIDAVAKLEPGSRMWADWRYSGIFTVSDCPTLGGAKGVVHGELVERTGGVAGDLCLQNFAPVFDELAKKVTSSVALACEWSIPAPPPGETFNPNKTNVQITLDGAIEPLRKAPSRANCTSGDAWHYDDESSPSKVVVCPTTCDRMQAAVNAQVDVLFGCDTVAVLL